MATALDLATNLTGAGVTEGQAKTWFTAMRAALAEMGDPLASFGLIQNLSLVLTVGSSALTANVKTRAGAAPSATDPVSVAMRNATLATGDFNIRNIVSALSLVVSSGSTLGRFSVSNLLGRLFWYLIDNAGSLELAVSSSYFGMSGRVSTTAEGGSGGADSARVMYSATARSNVAFVCIARSLDTQTTIGTWASAPSRIELAPFAPNRITGQGADLASATYITLGADGDFFVVTGTTTIVGLGALDSAGNPWWGEPVTLLFSGTTTVTNNGAASNGDKAIRLLSNTNFTAGVRSTLTLRYNSQDSFWYETSRSVN